MMFLNEEDKVKLLLAAIEAVADRLSRKQMARGMTEEALVHAKAAGAARALLELESRN